MRGWLPALLWGLGAGVLSAWGVGGGTVLLLVMTLLLEVEQRQAQLINLLFFLPTAAAGLFFHRKNGYLNRRAWCRAAPAAALLAARVDTAALRPLFGLFLLWGGLTMLRQRKKR